MSSCLSSNVPACYQEQRGTQILNKALLLPDNAPSHPNIDDLVSENIRAKFLPLNTTSQFSSMDQGILESLI